MPDRDKLPVSNERDVFVSRAEMEQIVALLERPEHRDFIRFLFFTGKRPGAVRQLLWTDVDMDRGIQFRAVTVKTRKREFFPVYRQVKEVLQQRLAARMNELVFHDGHGRELKEFAYYWRLAACTAGFRGVQIRDMRSSFVTFCNLNQIPTRTIMKLSGHRTHAMVIRYHKVDEEEMRGAVQTLEKVFAEA